MPKNAPEYGSSGIRRRCYNDGGLDNKGGTGGYATDKGGVAKDKKPYGYHGAKVPNRDMHTGNRGNKNV